MKKLLTLLLALTVLLSGTFCMFSCNDEQEREAIRIGVLAGPTGMGMAKLIDDNKDSSEKYVFTVFSDPQQATSELASGNLDMLCLPTNTAAALANKTPDYISVCAINTLGSLYVLSDGASEIKSINDLDGKTIVTSVPNSTTGPIIQYIMSANGVNATIEFEPDHDSLVARIKSGSVSIAILPEPKVTAAISSNNTYSVDLNLTQEWSKISDLPLTMGCIVVKNEYIQGNKSEIDEFLFDYKNSIDFIGNPENIEHSAQMIVDAGIIPKLGVAKKSLSNLYGSIVYIDGLEMKNALKGFYSAINLKQPDDSFYYEK